MNAAAKVSDSHGERDCLRIFRRYGLYFHVPISSLHVQSPGEESGVGPADIPYLKISDFFKVLLKKHARLLFGGIPQGEDSKELLRIFWSRYKDYHPEHVIYRCCSEGERQMILPICLHGDKGRGYQKSPVYCYSWEPVFGLPEAVRNAGSKADRIRQNRRAAKQCHGGNLNATCSKRAREFSAFNEPSICEDTCSIKRRKLENFKFHEALQPNFRGCSLLSHFLIGAVPSKVFKANPLIIPALQEAITKDLQFLFKEGVTVNGTTFRACLIGSKGDFEEHYEAGNFVRYHGNVGTRNSNRMCPFCHAGDSAHPFEDVGSNAAWLQTVFETPPWETEPALAQAPFTDAKPASLFKVDMFHTLKYGFCRDLVGSLLLYLARLTYFDGDENESKAVDERLSRAFSWFSMWQLAFSKNSTLKRFSKSNLHCKKANQFPWIGGKGADTVLTMMWLDWFLAMCMRDPREPSHQELLAAMQETVKGGLSFIGVMHSHDLFLPPSCAAFFHRSGLRLLRGYAYLAQQALNENLNLFCLRPKIHYYDHALLELRCQLEAGHPWILSPAIFNCEACEDFIGRISRLSRRVSPRKCSERVIHRYLVGVHLLFERAGM